MTISYNWLSEYLPDIPERPDPVELSSILTAIGLEVESLEKYEEIKGGLQDLVVGEVLSCIKHPDADKLKITSVDTGNGTPLNIVCGASNVAAGLKVVVARAGTTIHPFSGETIKLKKAKIRGVESDGMICAEDEIGISNNHEGILILPPEVAAGTLLADVFIPYNDHIYEIGLTPNRMDAMSHLGVAKDICAWLSHHHQKSIEPVFPFQDNKKNFNPAETEVIIENTAACMRYCGAVLTGITVTDSPLWLRQKLKAIGLKPINNIVDITNFILHETGQPLHAFDAEKISGNKIIVKNAIAGTLFKTLDEKDKILSADDLMILNQDEAMCIAGIYGGINSGVTAGTTNIFLESAWFNPAGIRKTSLRLGLRTDAATRFEKGVDVSNTFKVLQRAALLIIQIAGGEIVGLSDHYPEEVKKKEVELRHDFLQKLSGKKYSSADAEGILKSLGFRILKNDDVSIVVEVPHSKPDISLPADVIEEIMRIDGLDNVEIPRSISISPSIDKSREANALKERMAGYLTGSGFYEIFTNSITDSNFYTEDVLAGAVKMINSLNNDLNILRPYLLQGGLQVIAHNINRKNNDLKLFEFGKSYSFTREGKYAEVMHLILYATGNLSGAGWKIKQAKTDYFYLKGIVENILKLLGIQQINFEPAITGNFGQNATIVIGQKIVGYLGEPDAETMRRFDIKSPVFFADISWDEVLSCLPGELRYREISKFPSVSRDLAIVIDKNISYSEVERTILSQKIPELREVILFDIFESEKLGAGKKSMALSFTFLSEVRTLTDKEIDIFMQRIITGLGTTMQAQIRKQ